VGRIRAGRTSAVLAALAGALAFAGPARAAGPAPAAHASVVGGAPAPAAAWPFMAALLDPHRPHSLDAQFCGGTLVGPRAVVTAAHCVLDRGPGDVAVSFGTVLADAAPRWAVSAVIVHPGYDPADFGHHDLAVLRLAADAPFAPAALAIHGEDRAGTPALVAGFGNLRARGAGAYPDVLHQGSLVIGARRCDGRPFDRRLDLCAAPAPGVRTSSCDGDSGGPLVVGGRLAGVVSFGPAGCDGESYFVRVSAERAFLDAAIAGAPLPRSAAPPRLTLVAARSALLPVLRRRFGARFTHRTAYGAACVRRSRSAVVCAVEWSAAGWRYEGTVTLSVRRVDGGPAVHHRVVISRRRR
jgi:trypsin